MTSNLLFRLWHLKVPCFIVSLLNPDSFQSTVSLLPSVVSGSVQACQVKLSFLLKPVTGSHVCCKDNFWLCVCINWRTGLNSSYAIPEGVIIKTPTGWFVGNNFMAEIVCNYRRGKSFLLLAKAPSKCSRHKLNTDICSETKINLNPTVKKLKPCVAVPPSVVCQSLVFRVNRFYSYCVLSLSIMVQKTSICIAKRVLKVVLLKSRPEYLLHETIS